MNRYFKKSLVSLSSIVLSFDVRMIFRFRHTLHHMLILRNGSNEEDGGCHGFWTVYSC